MAFGIGHRNVDDIMQRGERSINPTWSPEQWREYRRELYSAKLAALRGYIDELRIVRDFGGPIAAAETPVTLQRSNKIFVVHGHDGELKQATARLVAQLGLEPVILHEQTNRGRTIIDKLWDHASEAGFAIVLLTADDVGGFIVDQADTATVAADFRSSLP